MNAWARHRKPSKQCGHWPMWQVFATALLVAACIASSLPAPNAYAAQQGADEDNNASRLFAESLVLYEESTVDSLRRAETKLRRALQIWQDAKDIGGQGLALNEIGLCLFRLSGAEQALPYFKEAIPLFEAIHDTRNEAAALSNLADAYAGIGDYESALAVHLEKSVPLREAAGDKYGLVPTLIGIGVTYIDLAAYDTAIDYLQRASDLAKDTGNAKGRAIAAYNIGFAYLQKNQGDEALKYFKTAQTLSAQGGEGPRIRLYILNGVAQVYVARHQYDAAKQQLDLAIRTSTGVADAKIKGIIQNNLGQVYLQLGLITKAAASLQDALLTARSARSNEVEARVLSSLMDASKQSNDYAAAIFFGKQAINAYQDIRLHIRRLDRGIQKQFLNSRRDSYRTLAELLIAEGRIAEAQQVLDMLKEDEFLEYIESVRANAPKQGASLTEQERKVEEQFEEISNQIAEISRRYQALIAKQNRTADEDLALKKDFDALLLANKHFQIFLSGLSRALGPVGKDKLFAIEENQNIAITMKEWGASPIILYTLVLPDRYRVIVITPNTQIPREYKIGIRELRKKIAEFRGVLQDKSKDPIPAAQALYKILIGPVEKDLEGAKPSTIMWSLDGVLRYIPPAALHDGKRFLVERYRNVIFTPASRDSLKELPSPVWRGVGFGVSKAALGFDALPNVPAELSAVIKVEKTDGPSTGFFAGKVFLDDDFSARGMQQEVQSGYQLVHVASHFQFEPGNQDKSFLLLGNSQKLTISDIKVMPNVFSGVELLTLSACNTALAAPGADGREVEGFAVLAQRQGAKAVVATLWNVVDQSTRIAFEQFYGHKIGATPMSKGEALQQAQLALLNGKVRASDGRNYSHPYYWAPFILIGNWK